MGACRLKSPTTRHNLFNSLWRLIAKKTAKLRVTGPWSRGGSGDVYRRPVDSLTMGLLPDTFNYGLRMRRECRESSPRHRLQKKRLVSDPGMHYGTCVTHVPWCMSGSLTSGGGENVPGIPGACTTPSFTYLIRGPWARNAKNRFHSMTSSCYPCYTMSAPDAWGSHGSDFAGVGQRTRTRTREEWTRIAWLRE